MFSFPECITWLAAGLTESVAIVTVNIITIAVFIKNRNLRKRSTYLVVNLAVVDIMVGGFSIYGLFYLVGINCNLWKLSEHWVVYAGIVNFFSLSSLTNITAIALERFHATMWPFRHRFIKKSVYGLIIAVIWVAAGLLLIALTVTLKVKGPSHFFYLFTLVCSICLLMICISYTSIIIKVCYGEQPQHHGAASRERKLTMTLLMVTAVSLVLYLPDILFHFLEHATGSISSMPKVTYTRLHNFLNVIFYANSLVNPILYAIRMPEYRSAVLALFRRRPQQQRRAAVFPLHDM